VVFHRVFEKYSYRVLPEFLRPIHRIRVANQSVGLTPIAWVATNADAGGRNERLPAQHEWLFNASMILSAIRVGSPRPACPDASMMIELVATHRHTVSTCARVDEAIGDLLQEFVAGTMAGDRLPPRSRRGQYRVEPASVHTDTAIQGMREAIQEEQWLESRQCVVRGLPFQLLQRHNVLGDVFPIPTTYSGLPCCPSRTAIVRNRRTVPSRLIIGVMTRRVVAFETAVECIHARVDVWEQLLSKRSANHLVLAIVMRAAARFQMTTSPKSVDLTLRAETSSGTESMSVCRNALLCRLPSSSICTRKCRVQRSRFPWA
jgi:hypothetical protein